MSEFKINVELVNAAFDEHGLPELELARILRELAEQVEHVGVEAFGKAQNLRDGNGNVVGRAKLHERDAFGN